MRTKSTRLSGLGAMLLALVLSLGLAACGSSDDDTNGESTAAEGSGGGGAIASNPANGKVTLTIGSKNFAESEITGEIYAQALAAAGYKIKTDLSLGSETIALKTLKQGEKDGLTAFPPTPFSSANAVGTTTKFAEEEGLETVSDLEGKSESMSLYGSPECRQRIDCLAGLEKYYGLKFKSFHPVDIGLRYTVLEKGQADLSILFTTDPQLSAEKDKFVILEDDKEVFPAGNVIFITDQSTAKKAGPDYEKTIVAVQKGLTLPVVQELNARVELEKKSAKQVAGEYLKSAGYVG
jgi:glycine betaine/choline ABC-type transport system substrate-binding protein